MMGQLSPPTVLLVEDNDEDYEATRRTFQKIGRPARLWRCVDGDDALDRLHNRGAYASAEAPPQLILLDLNLAAMDGREVLALIKQDARLCTIPVVILTTSASPEDIATCYRHGANGYLIKPVALDRLTTLLTQVYDYWFGAVVLPERSGQHR